MSMGRAFTSPKSTPPLLPSSPPKPQAQATPHIQKVSGSIPPGSSPVLLFLLAVGCELSASFCCCGCCCCCCCRCFWRCFSPCCWQWSFFSGTRAIGAIEWCCCCRCCCWWCFWPCCLQSQAQERPAALAGG